MVNVVQHDHQEPNAHLSLGTYRMSQKKILIVDDHHHIREMLTALLSNHSEAFSIKSVPSGEEAMLELGGLDLLISDMRLPGLNGLALTKRLRRRKQETAVILITGHEIEPHEAEAEKLNVFRFLKKPLQTEHFLQSVDYALYGEPDIASEPASVAISDEETAVAVELSRKAIDRLQSLQADTGASGIMLTLPSGQLIFENGHNERFNLPNIAKITSKSLANSLSLAEELDSKTHFTIQYNTSDKLEMYSTNIGDRFFLTLFFVVQARRGRIGTIWIFLQRAIADLAAVLPETKSSPIANGKKSKPKSAPTHKIETFAPDTNVLPTDEEFMRELQQLENAIAEIDRQNQKKQAKENSGRQSKRNYPPAVEPSRRRTRRVREEPTKETPLPPLSSKSAYEEAKERYEARMRAEKKAAPPPPDLPDVPEYKGPTAEELKLDSGNVDLSDIDEGQHDGLFSLFDNLDTAAIDETADFWETADAAAPAGPPSLDELIQQGMNQGNDPPDFTEEEVADASEQTAALSFEEAMKQGLLGEAATDQTPAAEETVDLFDLEKMLEEGLLDEAEEIAAAPENESLSFEEAMKRGLIPGLNPEDS